MSQLVRVITTDDINGTDGAETLGFALDGTSYEIDLITENAKRLREIFGPYIAAGRTISSKQLRKDRAGKTGASGLTLIDRINIRRWAKETGRDINERGRIPADVIREYKQTHG